MSSWRFFTILFSMLAGALVLLWRMVDLNIIERNFLLEQSNARILRVVNIPAYRGMITDRFGQPLAISAQVDSIWLNPQAFQASEDQLSELAEILEMSEETIQAKIDKDKEFIYLKRGVSPTITEKIQALNIPGLFFQHEYHRFYPQSEVTSHIIGFTNIDDQGQEGLELAYNTWLQGISGKKRILKDRLGHTISDLEVIRSPQQGHDLVLSIDNRIQFLAFEELKKNIQQFNAKAGSAIVLDTKKGEILAMVNQPSYNPNQVQKVQDGRSRNRAMTDLFEPGSTIKPFTIASALESGRYHAESLIDTHPGRITIGRNVVKDEHNNGSLTLAQVLQKSSDVGTAKISLSIEPTRLIKLLQRLGFGERTQSGFPGEASGTLVVERKLRPFELATLSFGYGLSVTAIQLAQAYSVIAAQGILHPVSLLKIEKPSQEQELLSPSITNTLLKMLETVVESGTGSLAKVPGYRVAGKTGTAYMAGQKGYNQDQCIASFAGIAPVSNPRLVVVVVIQEPQGKLHSGAQVAAPLFSKIMAGSLRLLNIAPDNLPNTSPLEVSNETE